MHSQETEKEIARDDVMEEAVRQVERDPPEGFSKQEGRQLAAHIRAMPFASVITLLGAQSFRPNDGVGEGWLARAADEAAKQPEAREHQVDAEAIKALLVDVFRHRKSPADVVRDPAVRHELLKLGIQQLSKQAGLSVSPQEIREVIEIVETGRFFGDTASLLRATLRGLEQVPGDMLATIQDDHLPRLPMALLVAGLRDVSGLPKELISAVQALRRPSEPRDEAAALSHVLDELKQLPLTKRALILLRAPLSPDNRSARLALMLYARAHGVTVSEETITSVYEAFDPEHPHVGISLRQALETLARECGPDQARKVVNDLQ